MCRVAFSTGPDEVPLSSLLDDPPHGLSAQAFRPREQQHGHVNVDGTGIAWWHGGDPVPLRYVTESTPWADPNLPDLARRLTGHTVLAAVRGATPGIGFGTGLVAPFVHDVLAFTHNGWIGGFREQVAPALLRAVPDDLLANSAALSDSTVVFHLVVAHHRRHGDLVRAVDDALHEVATACRAAGQPATLNVVISDGTQAVATRTSCGLPGNSLHLHAGDRIAIASEPLDDDGWEPVPDDTLLHVHGTTVATHPLSLEPTP